MKVVIIRPQGFGDYRYGDVVDVSEGTAIKYVRYSIARPMTDEIAPKPKGEAMSTASFAPPEENTAKPKAKARKRSTPAEEKAE